jgi:hypothetical protein
VANSNISGFQHKDLRRCLPDYDGRQLSHMLKRLRTHGLIKKIGRTYKYYLTRFGRVVSATVLKLREFIIIPSLALAPHVLTRKYDLIVLRVRMLLEGAAVQRSGAVPRPVP